MLLTIDGEELFAFEPQAATATWHLALPRALAAVVFGSPTALPVTGEAPWRTAASASVAFVVDVESAIHIVDVKTGKLVTSLEPLGAAPIAIAATPGAVALAVNDRVLLWRDGQRAEIAGTATAIAFSRDGLHLAIAKGRGFTVIDARTREEVFARELKAPVTGIEGQERDGWCVTSARAVWHVDPRRVRKLRALRVPAFATSGRNLAVGAKSVVTIWEQPAVWNQKVTKSARTEIEIRGRKVRGLAYASNGNLAIGLTEGDAAIVEESRLLALRRIARGRADWTVHVGSYGNRAPTIVPIVLVVLIIVVAVVASAIMRRDEDKSSQSPPTSVLRGACDAACESARLAEVVRVCNGEPDCADDVEAAVASVKQGRCSDARASLAQVFSKSQQRTRGSLLRAYVVLAQNGLATGCVEHIESLAPPRLMHLAGGSLEATDLGPITGDEPAAVQAAGDHALFVTRDRARHTCRVKQLYNEHFVPSCEFPEAIGSVPLYFFAFGSRVEQLDQRSEKLWTDLVFPGTNALHIAGDAATLFVAGENDVWAWKDKAWTREPSPPIEVHHLWMEGQTLYVAGLVDQQDEVLRREPNGAWSVARKDTGESAANVVWARGKDDVFAGYDSGLLHFDGKSWSKTDFTEAVRGLSGDGSGLYVITQPKE